MGFCNAHLFKKKELSILPFLIPTNVGCHVLVHIFGLTKNKLGHHFDELVFQGYSDSLILF